MRRAHVIHLQEDGPALHLLQTPLITTTDRERALRSRLTWAHAAVVRGQFTYRLTILGTLHALTGLTICTTPRNAPCTHHDHPCHHCGDPTCTEAHP